MADVDIDPFEEHESRPEDPMGDNIPLTPVKGSTWKPECVQVTSFRGTSHRTKLMKDYVKDLYKKLSENIGKVVEPFHFNYFKLEDVELYYRGNRNPLKTRRELKSVGIIVVILGKNRLRNLGFDIPRGKVTTQEAVMQEAE